MRHAFTHGSHVASECTGAFLLGAAGILNGKQATTHWFYADEFRRRFPEVHLRLDQLIVDEGNIVTCGGATSCLNLVIYLAGKHFGPDLAVLASKMFLIDMDRPSQLPFHIFSFPLVNGDRSIARSQKFIKENFHEDLGLEDLARQVGISLRNFSRRFKTATGKSVTNYVQEFRLQEAKQLLESSNLSASEIMYQVGYNDERSFRRLFKRHTGLSPKHYRNKFRLSFHKVAQA